MKKYLVLLTVLVFCFGASLAYADTCQETDSASGDDTGPVIVSITSPFSCTSGGTVTGMTLTTNNTDSYCDSWYSYTISVTHNGGTETSTGNCNVTDLDLASFNGATIDVSTITDVTVQSVDEDTYSDAVTVDVTLDITYTPVPGQPGPPTNPSPADGETNVAVDGTLTWDWGADTETYDLWFGEAGNMTEVVTGGTAGAEGSQGSYSYSGLLNDTEYEWQLILHNSNRVDLNGPVWRFTTELPTGLIQVGDGTNTDQYLPIEPYYKYDYTQTIYLSSQFGNVETDKRIEKLYYNYTKYSSDDFDEDDWVIYMGITTDTNLDGGWIDVSMLTEVFNGSVGFGALAPGDGWIEIPLAVPFNYNPTDGNLVIAVDENSDGYTTGSDDFYCTQDARANISRYYYTDGTNPDPTAPPSGTASAYYPNTRFLFADVPTTPEFSIIPDSTGFGTVFLGETSAPQTFTIINTGGGTLTISSVDITGTDDTEFSLSDSNTYPVDLGTGASTTVDVSFAPTTDGDKTANLTIVDNISRTTHEIPLTGTGFDPYITAFPYTQNFDDVTEPDLPLDWSKLNDTGNSSAYVETYEGDDHSSPNSAKLYNSDASTGNLMLISPPTTLNVSDTRVKFWCKTFSGNQNLIVGTMTDRTDATTFTQLETVAVDDSYAKYTVNITGRDSRTGETYIAFKHGMDDTFDDLYIDEVIWEEIPTTPVFDIMPDTKVFGAVGINETSDPQTFTIINDGVGTLTISSVSLTGTNFDEFSLTDTNTYAVELGTGESMTVDVAFAPTSEGAKSANLTIIDDLSRTQHDIPLTGEGMNYNYGGGEGDNGGYYFANSTSGASGSASQPTYDWYPNQTGGANEGTLIADTDFVNGGEDDGHTDFMNIFDDASNFNFFGMDYTQMYLSSNGTIGFGFPWHNSSFTSIPYDGDEQDLNNMIAWCWDDLEYDGGVSTDVNVRISRLSDRTVVTFWHYPEYQGDGGYVTAQVILYKNGNIKIQYNDAESTYDQDTENNTIGIENVDGTAGVQYRYNGVGGPMFSSPVAIMFGTDEGALPVELADFRAEVTSKSVKLIWETSSEIDNKGFYVYRSQDDENYQKISDLIPGSGTTTEPQGYEFVDNNVKYGNLYYYKISDIEEGTNSETFHPSIAVIAGKGIVDPDESFTPHKFALYQNAPNPFNPITEIRYDLPTLTHVNLNIYDMNGRLVKTLVDKEKDAGCYSVTWNGKDNTGKSVGSGVFIYRIETDHETQTRRMVLMK